MDVNTYNLNGIYRILDANANRAAEGLRTVEEYFRFIVEDANISTDVKQLRHDLMLLVSQFDRTQLLKHRDATGDIGRSIKTESEKIREDLPSIIAAASQRIQQSLRCLEEYAKLIEPSIAQALEQLRYRAYSLLATIELRIIRGHPWLDAARLYVLVDCQRPMAEFLDQCEALSQAGVDVLQIRDKQSDARMLLEYARKLCDRLDEVRTRVIINDRVDIVSRVGEGVHLGQADLPIADARSLLPIDACIGISTHTIEQAIEAQGSGANYIGCGPTFPSKTKAFGQFSGLEFLRRVAQQVTIPSFAIGGITLDLLDEVLATGIRRVAASHAIWHAQDPAAVAHDFRQRLSPSSIGEKNA